ncbi:hypothetical protein [Streptomyces sp. GC420]|uniref:hypothetical protein n=1 Tax=Streptomyces sp. GC420 TaxID=2697568 RepID=UPI001414FECE|nr:hypothetical protein [Streptomyces sp. GC420]NBM20766.1 hypothetical protein [Streptomyces sp. GC420]
MSFTSPTPRNPQPDALTAHAANDAIRRLVDEGAGGEWPAEEYEMLLIQWAAATSAETREDRRGEMVEAA